MIASNLETRVRTYLNEVTANFYTQAEIWRWLSNCAREISQKTLCVRRSLTTSTGGNGVREVSINAYKTMHVQYSTKMLGYIDPLQLGRYPFTGTVPQYWYESGSSIGIEPLPDAIYSLKVYVADVAKLVADSPWTDWTAGARWVVGDSVIHSGASSDLTLTAGVTSGKNYTFEFQVTGIGTSSTLLLTAGTLEAPTISTNGWHVQSIIPNGTTLKLTGVGDVTVDSFRIYKEADISAITDELELGEEWSNTLALYATYSGLFKDKAYSQAALLQRIYANDFEYIRQNIIDVIPDGRAELTYL